MPQFLAAAICRRRARAARSWLRPPRGCSIFREALLLRKTIPPPRSRVGHQRADPGALASQALRCSSLSRGRFVAQMFFLSCGAGRKPTVRAAGIVIAVLVRGLYPARALRRRTVKVPKPGIQKRLSLRIERAI